MSIKPVPIHEKNVPQETINAILANFETLPKNWKQIPPFCVDGRKGARYLRGAKLTQTYPQALGGSLNIAVVKALLKGDLSNFPQIMTDVFGALKENDFALGVHGDDHAFCGCGFCNNLAEIIKRLKIQKDVVLNILTPHITSEQQKRLDTIMDTIQIADENELSDGKSILHHAQSIDDMAYQELTGSHQEQVAVVNMTPDTSLNVDNNQVHPAFNLDVWYIQEQARALHIDPDDAALLTLGLYVATEMVLVEDVHNERLPIVIHQ